MSEVDAQAQAQIEADAQAQTQIDADEPFWLRVQRSQAEPSNVRLNNSNSSSNNGSDYNSNRNSRRRRRRKGPREPEYYIRAEMSIREAIPIKVSEETTIKVFDYMEGEEITVNPLAIPKNIVVFKTSDEFYFQYPKEVLLEDLNNNQNIVFKCREMKRLAPYKSEVFTDKPYYLLRGPWNFAIPMSDIVQTVDLTHPAYELRKIDHFDFTTSYDSVIIEYPKGFRGRNVNVGSADHCQEGTGRDVYELIPLEFIDENKKNNNNSNSNSNSNSKNSNSNSKTGGGITYSRTRKQKKVIRSMNRFPTIHTLTGSVKNIERRIKSLNKAKKVLGTRRKN